MLATEISLRNQSVTEYPVCHVLFVGAEEDYNDHEDRGAGKGSEAHEDGEDGDHEGGEDGDHEAGEGQIG